MGNALPSCCTLASNTRVKLVFFDGTTKMVTGNVLAGQLLFEYPDQIICHADSFYIGHPIPALAIDDELVRGETYFVLPIDPFANQILTTKLVATAMSPTTAGRSPAAAPLLGSPAAAHGQQQPFEYIKGSDGRMLIKLSPEFLMRRILQSSGEGRDEERKMSNCSPLLCSTPELQKHYLQLVAPKELLWSPKLESISEHKKNIGRMSSSALFRL
ncbi:hypothetical protein ACLOJK_000503 [Asimina triloba]